ncbi:MAG TPA: type III pantothenate kinase [Bacteroidales bacterium]|nr:type III pantothenate kinase [Bacteroidales bacterium]HSA44613.1 type III pantothenate kinase [Bacteroidales bacterium]
MKKLALDVGNTLVKAGVFEGKQLRTVWTERTAEHTKLLMPILKEGPYAGIILSAVTGLDRAFSDTLQEAGRLVILDEATLLPLRNLYQTPATLGRDRLAAAVGARALFPGRAVLVIVAGTCITYDLVTARGEYLGGSIAPGIRMRFQALNTFTGQLPLLEPDLQFSLPGTNTRDSILSGVMQGVLLETDAMIARYGEGNPGLQVVLSGGDADFFENRLKNSIFASPNIVLKGLNEILDYHAER